MKVVNLCVDDWANFQYDITKSMRAVGIDAYGYKLNRHVSNYPEQCEIAGVEVMRKMCRDADVVNFIHSNERLFAQICPAIPGKTINVWYTGTVYRRNPALYNAIFNPRVNKSVVCLGEFVGKGAKNEVYMVGAVDTGVDPVIKQGRPYRFGHYPSNAEVKGTATIVELMAKCVNGKGLATFEWSTEHVDAVAQWQRMANCDIYIELLAPLNEGNVYGSFGMSALEAGAMGKAVVTMNLHRETYRKHYGDCPLVLVDDAEDFLHAVIALQFSSVEALQKLREQTREWVVANHSHEATGRYILQNILQS